MGWRVPDMWSLSTGKLPVDRGVALVLIGPVLKRLPLKVLTMEDVDTMMKITAIERSNCFVETGDELLIGSALRCLTGIGGLWRISPAVIVGILRTDRPFTREHRNCVDPIVIALAEAREFDSGIAAAREITPALLQRVRG
jgi:hypothetical protein